MSWINKWRLRRKLRAEMKLRLKEQVTLLMDKQERQFIANTFNDRYTLGTPWQSKADRILGDGACGRPTGGYRWMCPHCNQIHAPIEHRQVSDGLRYPGCCTIPAGPRGQFLTKIGNLKRPLGWCGPRGLYLKILRAGLKPHPDLEKFE